MSTINIGIKNIGVYLPPGIRDAAYISQKSGIPEEVIRKKFGIKQIHKAGPEEGVTQMAIKAARNALNGFEAKDLDLVVYCGSEYKDYYLYNCAAAIQHALGATRANAFEIHSLCSAGAYSLKILKSMMLADPSLKHVLLVSSSKEADLIDYSNHRSRFMFNFGDGAAAVLLERGLNQNIILESHMITKGEFAKDVAVYEIGCQKFPSPGFHLNNGYPYCLDVADIKEMKRRLDPIALNCFIQVIEQALNKSGFHKYQLGYLAPIFMKKSILQTLLQYFNLSAENTFLLEEYGHCQSADAFISLFEGKKRGRLKKGDLSVLFGAGTGYTWAATAVRWG